MWYVNLFVSLYESDEKKEVSAMNQCYYIPLRLLDKIIDNEVMESVISCELKLWNGIDERGRERE